MTIEEEGRPPRVLTLRLEWHLQRFDEFYRESRLMRLKADRQMEWHKSMLGQDHNHVDEASCTRSGMNDVKRKEYVDMQIMYDRWCQVEMTAIQFVRTLISEGRTEWTIPPKQESGAQVLPMQRSSTQDRLQRKSGTFRAPRSR